MIRAASNSYYWSAAGQMSRADVEAGTVEFTYNADGQRAVKQSTEHSETGFLYDYKHLLHETDEVGGEQLYPMKSMRIASEADIQAYIQRLNETHREFDSNAIAASLRNRLNFYKVHANRGTEPSDPWFDFKYPSSVADPEATWRYHVQKASTVVFNTKTIDELEEQGLGPIEARDVLWADHHVVPDPATQFLYFTGHSLDQTVTVTKVPQFFGDWYAGSLTEYRYGKNGDEVAYSLDQGWGYGEIGSKKKVITGAKWFRSKLGVESHYAILDNLTMAAHLVAVWGGFRGELAAENLQGIQGRPATGGKPVTARDVERGTQETRDLRTAIAQRRADKIIAAEEEKAGQAAENVAVARAEKLNQASQPVVEDIEQRAGLAQSASGSAVKVPPQADVAMANRSTESVPRTAGATAKFDEIAQFRKGLGLAPVSNAKGNPTVTKFEIGGQEFFGASSGSDVGLPQETQKFVAEMAHAQGFKQPTFQSLRHGEADALVQAYDRGATTLGDRTGKLYVDKEVCKEWCNNPGGIPHLLRALGMKEITVYDPVTPQGFTIKASSATPDWPQ